MKRLIPFPPPFIDYHNEIVQKRNNPAKRRLNAIRLQISGAFDEYAQRLANDSLARIGPLKVAKQVKGHLIYCYKAERDDLYFKIKNMQSDELKSICQYCGIGEPTTLDHFIPQAEFPEFSIFLLNLVLACAHCNNMKLGAGRENGSTLFIHLYHDEIELNQFLFCNIVRTNNGFVPLFRLTNNGAIPKSLFLRIKEHFRRLELLKRFRDQSNACISGVRDAILLKYFIFTRRQKRRLLHQQVLLMRRQYGLNNWRTALHEGLAASNEFLDSTSSPFLHLSNK